MKTITLIVSVISLFLVPPKPVTIYLAGDSTMADKLAEKRPETGWGEKLQQFFDEDRVRIENHARNGRSTRTFLEEHRWDDIMTRLTGGDYVFIQFGHNDESKQKVDRYTPPEDFRKNLIRFVRDVRSKKAIPVLLTPVMRRQFDKNGIFYDTHGEYPDIVRDVAREHDVPLIDMHKKTRELVTSYGEDKSKDLFLHVPPGQNSNYPKGIEDNTHFSPFGAELVARQAAEGIKEAGIDLARYVRLPK